MTAEIDTEPSERRSGNGAVGAVLRDGLSLARTELSLFKAEMSSNAAGFAKGAAMFLAASSPTRREKFS